MSLRRRLLVFAVVLSAAVAALPEVAGFAIETEPTISAIGSYGSFSWSPSSKEVAAGGKVIFQNSTPGVPHGIVWTGGPETPTCTGVPIEKGEEGWKGSCEFTKAGTYTFRCYVHSYMTGSVTVANPGEPVATTESATAVTETSATLRGTVNPDGHETTYHFRRGRTTSYEEAPTPTEKLAAGSTGVGVSATLSGLAPGTIYHFRLVAENEKGTVEGADETFTTASPSGPPSAATGEATSLSETGATLHGTVNPDGEATKYVFDYGATTAYGQHSTEVTLPATDHTGHPVSATLTGLAPGAAYHFRLVATNPKGTAEGSDGVFTTASPFSPPSEPPPGGTTTATTAATTPVAPPPPKLEEASPLVAGSLRLAAPRHGTSVRGSIEVSRSGAGGRLEVDLVAKNASLARRRHRATQVTVGRLVRSSVPAGKVPFSVALNARAKAALRRHRRLAITVRIVLTSPSHEAHILTRGVVLRA